jgi:hypothetical protein
VVGDEDEVGREALLIAVALSDSDILDGEGIRGDKGAGSRVRSIDFCKSTVGDTAGGDEAGTNISAGGAARVLGTLVEVTAGSSTNWVVDGIFGLEFRLRRFEISRDPCSGASTSWPVEGILGLEFGLRRLGES